jgi:hypothetical protein
MKNHPNEKGGGNSRGRTQYESLYKIHTYSLETYPRLKPQCVNRGLGPLRALRGGPFVVRSRGPIMYIPYASASRVVGSLVSILSLKSKKNENNISRIRKNY